MVISRTKYLIIPVLDLKYPSSDGTEVLDQSKIFRCNDPACLHP
jgi:hypothetical protein